MVETPALDVQLTFFRRGGTFSMPHGDYTVAFAFTDIGAIPNMLRLHGVHCDVIADVMVLAEKSFAEHCRILRERERLGPLETVGGAGIILACLAGAAAWAKGITVMWGWIGG